MEPKIKSSVLAIFSTDCINNFLWPQSVRVRNGNKDLLVQVSNMSSGGTWKLALEEGD